MSWFSSSSTSGGNEGGGSWKGILAQSVDTAEDLGKKVCLSAAEVKEMNDVTDKYPMRINPYYLGLMERKGDPIWLQSVPDIQEITRDRGVEDPLHEEGAIPGLTHRYPDRVLLLVSNQCAMYCRFCTRKRKVGDPHKGITREQISRGIEYIRAHKEVRDVVLSGGDPLLLPDSTLDSILQEVRSVPHVEIVRIGSRVPCVLPQRVTPDLCAILKKHHPLYMNVHFNHPKEVTEEAKKACGLLADAGVPLGCQTVLLKGVNDDPKIMKELMQKLLLIRVRPYYIYQCDVGLGMDHFRTKVSKGYEVIEAIRGHTSGLAVPHLCVDGAGGKVPLLPNYVVKHDAKELVVRNYAGEVYSYPEADD